MSRLIAAVLRRLRRDKPRFYRTNGVLYEFEVMLLYPRDER